MPGSKYFSFMVDDMIFFREFDLEEVVDVLLNQPDSLAVHLKLYPGITYSHTNDKYLPVPSLEMAFPDNI